MKLYTTITFLLISGTAFSQSQSFINTHQHMLFELAEARPEQKLVNVKSRINNQVPGHSPNFIQIESYGTPSLNFDIPEDQFKKEVEWGGSVFEATTGTGTSRGTAFLVGKDLVLTNKHVLANDKVCNKFGIDLNHVKEFVPCKEVLHCSKLHDFCLIKLDKMKNGKNIGEEVKPLNFSKKIPKPNEMTVMIGNAYGQGIQGASYKGVVDLHTDWGHFSRAFSGNSGSPLLNVEGEILGIHYGRGGSADYYKGPSDRNIGLAVKSSVILKEISGILAKEELASALHSDTDCLKN